MKPQALILSCILIILLSLSNFGCNTFRKDEPKPVPSLTRDTDIREIDINHTFIKIPKPVRPIFFELNPEKHIAALENIEILLNNLELYNHYTISLEKTVSFYESQTTLEKEKKMLDVEKTIELKKDW
jgi:hypothetical protein